MDTQHPSSRSPYKYDPLSEGHFRVLEITSIEPTVTIQLAEYPNDKAPDYHAVSYAWGSQPNTEVISCDNAAFCVTPHLYEGLQCIYKAYGPTKLWADAICIDQTSNAEKAVQVARMHNIYHKAASVYIWLGKAEDDSDLVMDAMQNLEIAENPKDRDDVFLQKMLHMKSEATKLFDGHLFKPIAALSRRSWFRRLWIAQEYFMANKVVFFCGFKVLDGAKFIRMLDKLSLYSFTGPEPSLVEEYDIFQGFRALTDLHSLKDEYAAGKPLSFFDFVMSGRKRFVKEPVDRIYAAFGMAEGCDQIYRKNIQIDYSEEAREEFWRVYTQFGKIALQHEPQLRLLDVVSSSERPRGLPSWCPNIDSEQTVSDLDSVYAAGWPWHDHLDIVGPNKCHSHSNFKGAVENHVLTATASDSVAIWGAALGRIRAISAHDWNSSINTDDIRSIQKLAEDFLRFARQSEEFCQKYSKFDRDVFSRRPVWNEVLPGANSKGRRKKRNTNSETPQGSTQRASTSNDDDSGQQDKQGEESEPTDQSSTQALADYQSKANETDLAYTTVLSILTSILAVDPDEDWKTQNPELEEYLEVSFTWIMFLDELWHGRVLFATENGYIGFASDEVTVGDTVTVLYGGKPLFVLRKEQGGVDYQFISDAYVYECVDGQIFEMLDQGLVKEELFSIS
jgi:hypothetical protein